MQFMIEINILDDEFTGSRLGMKKSGERKAPLTVDIQEVTTEELANPSIQELLGISDKNDVLDKIRTGEVKYHIARDPGTQAIVAYSSVTEPADNSMYLEVLPDYQGRKIGPQLVKSMQSRYQTLSLNNFIGPDGQVFYEGLGFKSEGMPGHMVWKQTDIASP